MISVILPTYNESGNLRDLHARLSAVADTVPSHHFEFVFVDDCSTDETPAILAALRQADPRVHIIRLARRCGSHAAVAAGLAQCGGDGAVMLASDLQDPPELIPRLLLPWTQGYKVVWGVRERRDAEPWLVRASSRLYYHLMNRLTDVHQPPAGNDVFLIDRAVIDAFNRAPEKNTSVYMLIAWLGFPQTHLTYVKEARHSGVSKWTFSKRFKLFFDSLISFSYVPLRFMSLAGVSCAVLGLLYGMLVFVNAVTGRVPNPGWASLMVVVLVLGGFQMAMLGVLGEYLWRTYDEGRGRPRYVIERNTLIERAPQS
jgi:dolichol-phosphate mannosyltransferase